MKFEIPVALKIGLLVLGATALYTYIGQMVPQKQVAAPEAVVFATDVTTEDLVGIGRGIVEDKGQCLTCHTGIRAPDFGGVATRAESRIEGMEGLQYLANSLYHPNDFIVPGFTQGMTPIDKPPIALTDQEILAVLAFLQSQGGTPTVTLETTKADLGVE
jgi:mono/diheme cytochrome c family protein